MWYISRTHFRYTDITDISVSHLEAWNLIIYIYIDCPFLNTVVFSCVFIFLASPEIP